jgi:hypothetical protein
MDGSISRNDSNKWVERKQKMSLGKVEACLKVEEIKMGIGCRVWMNYTAGHQD